MPRAHTRPRLPRRRLIARVPSAFRQELKEAGPKYRQLLAERDLEDALGGGDALLGEDASGCSCVWGNPCVSAHCCKDWKNRFEVAKKNGWKGF